MSHLFSLFAGDTPEIMLDVDKQVTCMNNALDIFENNFMNTDGGIWNYLLRLDPLREHACTWRGVECNDTGIITHFILTTYNPERRRFHVRLSWLPNTTAYIYVNHVFLHENFVDDVLPKDLLYFHFRHGGVNSVSARSVFNTKFLPAKMEEFIMHNRYTFFGTNYIPSLPLKIVLVSLTSLDLEMAFIDNNGLPEDLKQVVLRGSGTKVTTVDGDIVDKRVSSDAEGTGRLVQSMYAKTFAEKIGAVDREVIDAMD